MPRLTAEEVRAAALAELAVILRTDNEKRLLARILGSGIAPLCGRCGGCGEYSYNQRDGSRCFGCNGLRVVLPKNAKQWAETVERAKSLDVDAYLDGVRMRAEAEKATDTVMAAWVATGISGRYSWMKAADASKALAAGEVLTPELAEHRRQADLNATMAACFDHVQRLRSAFLSAKTRDAKLAAAVPISAAVALALDVIAAAGRASKEHAPKPVEAPAVERTPTLADGIARLADADPARVAHIFGGRG